MKKIAAPLMTATNQSQDNAVAMIRPRIEAGADGPGFHDYKTRLQELAARRFETLPIYAVTDTGPDHAKAFRAVVRVAGVVRGTGEGRSKKQAEQAAAQLAWEALNAELNGVNRAARLGSGDDVAHA